MERRFFKVSRGVPIFGSLNRRVKEVENEHSDEIALDWGAVWRRCAAFEFKRSFCRTLQPSRERSSCRRLRADRDRGSARLALSSAPSLRQMGLAPALVAWPLGIASPLRAMARAQALPLGRASLTAFRRIGRVPLVRSAASGARRLENSVLSPVFRPRTAPPHCAVTGQAL